MRKFLLILATTFFFLGAYNIARSEECAQPLTPLVSAVTKNGDTIRPLLKAERDFLVDHSGPPPNVDEPYEINVILSPSIAMLIVTKGECIVGVYDPMPITSFNRLVGTSGA